ncbi:alpha-amylase family glycosyl hydrolase [Cellulophaga sp. Hel_I_12]|uniref:alpha-amylase family glycosyl hydrolase n=1 Tax=Cellulophaga sp. Hel_I_12 TaxID=1249972 RepID=UPI000648950D|nr:alpha-amylase family glycosyl hydrolase [Cellulophaga sp. Hel_I_12]
MNQNSLHQLLGKSKFKNLDKAALDDLFELRLATNSTLIKDLFFSLYPEENHIADFKKLLSLLPQLFKNRPIDLKKQDIERLQKGTWYQSEKIVGMQLYVDHFNKDINGLSEKLHYFETLGVNFLHLMPITTRPKEENDGGYAVNSYTEVDKKYGTKNDLLNLTQKLRKKGMFLMLDFVVNHTSDEFSWAKKAQKGDLKYQNYYYTYPDRKIPDAFERSLPEVFPSSSPGNFTYNHDMQKWVMTVFNSYQWDLNYSNPEVFYEMLTKLIKLADLGVDVVRFDALAFLWKKIGTDSQNLPEAHALISLFRMCLQIVAPGVILLAEAIVSPYEIMKYFGEKQYKGNECEVAYNATLMALLWEAIATTKTQLLYRSLQHLPQKPKSATWINYVRCHDDIGLGFEDQEVYNLGLDARQHRLFLLNYYTRKLSWSQARGEMFMYNPKTGDGRITGSTASLLGLEAALAKNKPEDITTAIKKIKMMHSIILAYGGIPLIYAGDEIGTLNDYSYKSDPNKKQDSRWVNRPQQNWATIADLEKKKTPESDIYYTLKNLIEIRKNNPVFADHNNFRLHQNENPHLLIFERYAEKERILIICNFDTHPQSIDRSWLDHIEFWITEKTIDLISNTSLILKNNTLEIEAYATYWMLKN